MQNLIVSDRQSYKFLDEKNHWDLVVWWHPLVSKNAEWEIELIMQESAFLNAIKLYKRKWWNIVLRFSNPKDSHKDLLKDDVSKWGSYFKLSDMVDDIVISYKNLLWDDSYLLSKINVIFQNQANGYVKSNLKSEKMKNTRWALKNLLLSKSDTEYKTNCRWTIAWFLKLTWKINKSSSNILVCLWADNRSSYWDIVWWITWAKHILWLKQKTYFAYFDEWKNMPMIKCW